MKQIITLIIATFILTAINASGKPYKTPIKIESERSVLKVSLLAGGKVNITWSAVANETTTTAYEIQKKENGGEFKTIAYLMGESYPVYSFRDKVTSASGDIEYRVITTDSNILVNTVSQKLLVL